ncbi:Calx-beta domain-containing protein [Solimonas flava]|uniref:Calx-beta domain-containing protein n=1 Tax=Solimonas flava TaxID=415849 RepID=UPI0004206FC7|nr:Calx-beta domain-containing protein [Solimonas flava]
MFTVVLRQFWRFCVFGLLASLALGARAAAPQVTTINGNPLTIRVGDDASFQILNAEVPGVGQFYPSDSEETSEDTADFGWFLATGGELYAPNFGEHPNGTATGSLAGGLGKPYQVLTPVSLSGVTGTGSANDPYRVTVVNDVGATGLRATVQLSYVNGRNYYSMNWTVRNTGTVSRDLKVFLGGDIYLANDDSGIPYFDTNSSSPGGKNCPPAQTLGAAAAGGSDYYILLIPQTPADAYSAKGYSEIWQLIGQGQLDNVVLDECIDNGAALQWNRTLAPGASTVLQTGTSFGEVPDIAQFNITDIQPNSGRQGESFDVTLTGIGFMSFDSRFEIGNGVTLSNIQVTSATSATARVTIDATATPGARDVSGGQTAEGPFATLQNGFTVLASETPPSGSLQLNAATYTVNEGAGTVTISVARNGGSSGAVSVRYATANGTAQAGSDYGATDGTLTWADGDAAVKTFTVAITDDSLDENNETFSVQLSAATGGATLGERTTATVTIVDNDGQSLPGEEGKVERGGGALGLPLLAVLGLFATLRRKAQRCTAWLAALGLAAAMLPGAAAAGDWYLGTRVGLSDAGIDSASLTRALRNDGHAVTAHVDDRRDLGGVLYGGYHWTPSVDLELGYLRLGQTEAHVSGDLGNGHTLVDDLADELPAGGDAVLAALRLRFPIAGPLSFTPRLGGYWWTSETELHTAQRSYRSRDSGLGLDAGLGFDLRFAERFHVGLNGELLRSSSAGALKLYTLQFEYDF